MPPQMASTLRGNVRMLSMIESPARASTATSRPSLSVTTSLTLRRGRSAGVVWIEAAAGIASLRAAGGIAVLCTLLGRTVIRGLRARFGRCGLFGGWRFRGRLRVSTRHHGHLLRGLDREVLVLEAFQQDRRTIDRISRPLPDIAAAVVDHHATGTVGRFFLRRRSLFVRWTAHILSNGLPALLTATMPVVWLL